MLSKNPAQRLSDILDNIQAISEFTTGMTFDVYTSDLKTVYAVTRALEIISEASRRLPDELKQRHPEIDWAGVSAAGNVYRHEYDVVMIRWCGIQSSTNWRPCARLVSMNCNALKTCRSSRPLRSQLEPDFSDSLSGESVELISSLCSVPSWQDGSLPLGDERGRQVAVPTR